MHLRVVLSFAQIVVEVLRNVVGHDCLFGFFVLVY